SCRWRFPPSLRCRPVSGHLARASASRLPLSLRNPNHGTRSLSYGQVQKKFFSRRGGGLSGAWSASDLNRPAVDSDPPRSSEAVPPPLPVRFRGRNESTTANSRRASDTSPGDDGQGQEPHPTDPTRWTLPRFGP